jgi:hypothetical protein
VVFAIASKYRQIRKYKMVKELVSVIGGFLAVALLFWAFAWYLI